MLYGRWTVRYPGFKFTLIFKPGRVTLNGRRIRVSPSKNKNYPYSMHWLQFQSGRWRYFIRKTRSSFYTLRINRRGKVQKGSGSKHTSTSVNYNVIPPLIGPPARAPINSIMYHVGEGTWPCPFPVTISIRLVSLIK